MKSGLALFVPLALSALTLAGCGVPRGAAPAPAAYSPYDQESNPFCGALGTCEPLNGGPHPIRSSSIPG